MPEWNGANLKGGTLFIHAEQGLGDTLQFLRFIEQAKSKCGRIVLACQAPLIPLLDGISTIDKMTSLTDAPPQADAHAALLSLPRLLAFDGTNTPCPEGYISAPATLDDKLQLPPATRKRIGLVWSGSPDNKIERRRKMDIGDFLPLFESTNADFVALQVGPAAKHITALPKDRFVFACDSTVKNFADTAAIVSQLDLVIGVDTSVIHLSGAMGVPTWTIVPFMPD